MLHQKNKMLITQQTAVRNLQAVTESYYDLDAIVGTGPIKQVL